MRVLIMGYGMVGHRCASTHRPPTYPGLREDDLVFVLDDAAEA